jgi:predicted nucleic acid-binding protein
MVVVADTSVLLNLCRVQLVDLLPSLFGEVWIPPMVEHEFGRLSVVNPRFAGLQMPIWVKRSAAVVVPDEVSACPDLDPGETEALALALSLRADYVLVDDLAARRAAILLKQRSTGIGGILLLAKGKGLIRAVGPCLDQLDLEARFYLSKPIREELLRLAGEAH